MGCPRGVALLLSLSLGCYAPHDAVTSDAGGTSGTSSSTGATTATTSSSTSPSSTETASTSEGSSLATADETAGDLPPELASFSVNGSETPAEILEAELVEIQVAATDDIGIDRVEFYDGDTLIATFTEPPYVTELLMTSADNGGHSYTAVAYDTAQQMAEAGPIPLSVGIDGGAVLELQDAGFDGYTTLLFNAPQLVQREDTILLVAASQYYGADFEKVRVAVAAYSSGLSLLASAFQPVIPTAGGSHYQTFGNAAIDQDGDLLLTAQVGMSTNGSSPTTLYRSPGDAAPITSVFAVGAPSVAGVAVAPDGGVIVATGTAELSRYDPSLSGIEWTTDLSPGLGATPGVQRLSCDSAGGILADGFYASSVSFLRKLSADGDILWTREVDESLDASEIPFTFSAVGPDDTITQVVTRSEAGTQGLRMLTYDEDGTELHDMVLAPGEFLIPLDISYDPTGRIVVAARAGTDAQLTDAWVGRYEPDGTEIWSTTLDVGSGGSLVSGVLATSDARLYVAGMSETVGVNLLAFVGPSWVAELAL